MINIDINKGDYILVGRFKNKRIEVKEFGVDEHGLPTINGRGILKIRIEKLMKTKKQIKESKQFSLAEVAKKILTENANLYKKLMQKVSKLTGDQTAEDIFKKYTEKYINHPSYSNDNIQANLILLSTKEMQDMMDDLDYVY